MKLPHLISLLICSYCIMNATDLFEPWTNSWGLSPDALAFAMWVSPVLIFWCRPRSSVGDAEETPVALGAALFLSFFGSVGSLRVFCHAGLALSFAALLPAMRVHLAWLASSCSWMPVFDWVCGRFFPGWAPTAKILASSLPALYLTWAIGRGKRGGA
jgi:hypothetical protein